MGVPVRSAAMMSAVPVEGERTGGHAAVTDGHQGLEPADVGRLDDGHRVRAVLSGGPLGVGGAGDELAARPAVGLALRDEECA